jgi:hypothetical protein
MTSNQQDILIYAIKQVTKFEDFESTNKLKLWLTQKGIEVVEKTLIPSFGKPGYMCNLIQGQVTLHQSSGYSPEAALLNCVGEYCKNLLIEQYMNS